MKMLLIPIENLRFLLGTTRMDAKWLDINFLLHFLSTLLMLYISSFIINPSINAISGYFIVATLALFPFVCYTKFEMSALTYKSFRRLKFAYQLIAVVHVIHSMIKIEVERNISKMAFLNTTELAMTIEEKNQACKLGVEWIIIFLILIGTHLNGKFFRQVVSIKMEHKYPSLYISWNNKFEKCQDDKPPKYEESTEKKDMESGLLVNKENDVNSIQIPFEAIP